ncbi:MAG: 1,4-dihydroxy-2-naphthoate octaprenyltransferase [Muribaculaceae bacterium]|nr:1,4-dihydroxy-2-naphthoate octaprenyltransferase [Muribaculaceae bacterium]
MKMKAWIEAMRLRTLPVSIAGVLTGCGIALAYRCFQWLPALICLTFAIAAQIVSNFANEYFDFKNGLDRKGREGFRRGVTEGDISPEAMKRVMLIVMALDCLLGLTLIYWGGIWLIAIGIVIVLGAFAYSAGPYPLSHHALGDEAVVLFYGIVPVCLTAYVQSGGWSGGEMQALLGPLWLNALIASVGVGLLGANVLTVNNIRDVKDDAAVGKRTKAVAFGAGFMRRAYAVCAYAGIFLIWLAFRHSFPLWGIGGYLLAGICCIPLIRSLFTSEGVKLNAILRQTALLLLAVIVWTLVAIAI